MLQDTSYFRRSIIRQIIIILYWISGFGVSISLVLWNRMLSSIWDETFMTFSFILITFLVGVAAGSYYYGHRIDKNKHELYHFMVLQLINGCHTVLLLLVIPVLRILFKIIFNAFIDQIILLLLFKFLITFALFIIPSFAIGAYFPILSRFFIQSSTKASHEVTNLLGINIFGAATGCLLAGFSLIPIVGIIQSMIFLAFLYFSIAGIVKFFIDKIKTRIIIESEFYDQQLKHLSSNDNSQSHFINKAVLIGFATTGFITISYLILWFRSFVFIMHENPYGVYLICTTALLGISIGLLLYPRIFQKQINILTAFSVIKIVIGAFGILTILFFPYLKNFNSSLYSIIHNTESWSWQSLAYFIDTIFICLIPTILVGSLFTIVYQVNLTNLEKRGQTTGKILFIFILGSIIGLIITTFIFIPYIGLQRSVIFVSLLNFVPALLVVFLTSIRDSKLTKILVTFGSVTVIFVLTIFISPNILLKLFNINNNGQKLLYAKADINTTLTVHQNQETQNFFISSNGTDITNSTENFRISQHIIANLPCLLHTNPDTILSIGFGTSELNRVISAHSINKIDFVVISDDIVKTSSTFQSMNFQGNNDFESEYLWFDGKCYIRNSTKKYDVILIQPWAFNSNKMNTFEFFKQNKAHLKHDGFISYAISLKKYSIEDFKIILNTFKSVFPFTSLWYYNNALTEYAVLIGNLNKDYKIDFNQLSQKLTNQVLLAHLSNYGLDTVYEILDCFIMGSDEIENLTKGVRINKRNKPHLEFSTSKIRNGILAWNQSLFLFKSYREPVLQYITNIDSSVSGRELTRLILDNYFNSSSYVLNALSMELLGNTDQALQAYRHVYMLNRYDQGAKRFLGYYYDQDLIESPVTPAELTENAKVYYQKMEYEKAINALNRALEMDSRYAPAYFGLGINFEILGKVNEAKKMYQKTLRLKPNLTLAQERLDSLDAKKNN